MPPDKFLHSKKYFYFIFVCQYGVWFVNMGSGKIGQNTVNFSATTVVLFPVSFELGSKLLLFWVTVVYMDFTVVLL